MLALGDECILGQRLRTQHVDMQIAVADVAKPDHFDIWIFTAQQRLHVVQECRHLADPHRHVVLVWAVRSEALGDVLAQPPQHRRSEEHTSELQSLMRISYAVFCLKKKKRKTNNTTPP